MADQQVFPTKGNLMATKKNLQLAALGYELLDRKRNILIREIMTLVEKAKELRSSIEETYKEAYEMLKLANMSMGVIMPYAECMPVENGIELSSKSVMDAVENVVEGNIEPSGKRLLFSYYHAHFTLLQIEVDAVTIIRNKFFLGAWIDIEELADELK